MQIGQCSGTNEMTQCLDMKCGSDQSCMKGKELLIVKKSTVCLHWCWVLYFIFKTFISCCTNSPVPNIWTLVSANGYFHLSIPYCQADHGFHNFAYSFLSVDHPIREHPKLTLFSSLVNLFWVIRCRLFNRHKLLHPHWEALLCLLHFMFSFLMSISEFLLHIYKDLSETHIG